MWIPIDLAYRDVGFITPPNVPSFFVTRDQWSPIFRDLTEEPGPSSEGLTLQMGKG